MIHLKLNGVHDSVIFKDFASIDEMMQLWNVYKEDFNQDEYKRLKENPEELKKLIDANKPASAKDMKELKEEVSSLKDMISSLLKKIHVNGHEELDNMLGEDHGQEN